MQLVLPDDVVLAREFAAGAESRTITLGADEIAADEMILDTGPATVARAMAAVDAARTLVWNGPMGAFEIPPFDAATVSLARHVAARTACRAGFGAGGGDTVAALNMAGVEDSFHYVSTAAGHFLNGWKGASCPVLPSCVRWMMQHNGVIFDLDGTLVHSSPDIAHHLNTALQRLKPGVNALSVENVEMLIGGGIRELVIRGMKAIDVTLIPIW